MASRATKSGYADDDGGSSEPQEDDELTKGKLQFLDYDDDHDDHQHDTTTDDSKMNAVSNGGSLAGSGRPSKAAELRTSLLRAKAALATDRHYQVTAALLFVILILSILLIYVSGKALAYALAGRSPSATCHSGPCLHASGRLVTSLNTSSSGAPCEDFFSYACGGWRSAHLLSENQPWYSVSDQVSDQIADDLRRYLDQVLPAAASRSSDPHLKVKRFYESCMALEDVDVLSLSYFKHDIQKAGGWNVMGGWAGADWNQAVAVERLHTIYGVDAFFRIDIGADDLDPQLPYIIKIYPDGLGLPRSYYFDPKFRSVVDAYKQYMGETVKIFGGTKFDSSQFAENTFAYEKRIAEITPDKAEYLTPASVFKRRFSIRELKLIAPSIKWTDVLQRFFSKARLNDNTRVLLAFEGYFRNVSNVISTTDSRGLNDYLIWRMVSTYAPYLSRDFRLVHRNFRQALLGMPSSMLLDDAHRWRFCLETTSKFMGYGLASLYINGRIADISNATVQAKNDVVNSIRETILKHSDSLFDWSSGTSQESPANEEATRLVNMKLKAMEVLVGQPNFVMKTDRLVAYYNEYMVQVKFLENIFEAIDHRHKKMEMLLSEKNVDTSWPVLPYEVAVRYDYAANKLYVPFGVLLPPFYSSSEPAVLQFGGLGVQVAAQLLKAFDLVGLHYGLPDGRLSSNRSHSSHRGFNRKLACLRDVLTGLKPESLKANETVSATYADIGALKVAHLAFREFIAKSGSDAVPQVLPSLRYTADQLFFLSYSQTMCSNIRPAAADYLTESTNQIADASVRVNAVLAQSDAFRDAFQCSAAESDSRPAANERRRCSLWSS